MQRDLGIPLLTVVALFSVAIGCSSSSATTDAAGPLPTVLSFANDVMPILQQNCTSGTACHGQVGNLGEEKLYLGEHQSSRDGTPVNATVALRVYNGIVGVKSQEDATMAIVMEGEPQNSYLWRKLSGDQNTLRSDCAKALMRCPNADCTMATPCGAQMPMGGNPLDATDLQTIADWIGDGAKNN